MVNTVPPDFAMRTCIHLKVIENGLQKCRGFLDEFTDSQTPELIDDAEKVITTAKSKLQCNKDPIGLDTDLPEEISPPKKSLKEEIKRLSGISKLIIPINLAPYGKIDKEILNVSRKASDELQTIFKTIMAILKI